MREAEEVKDLKIARRVMKDRREALHELAAQDAGRKLLDLAGSAPDIENIPRRRVKSGRGITTEMVREVEDAKLHRSIPSAPAPREEIKTKTRR
jgi:hypothetical protein